MGEHTGISWADNTFSPWWGCTNISPACDHCYAETWAHRMGHEVWGSHGERRFFAEKHWNEPLRWDRKAARLGTKTRVFCASMCDVFERHADAEIRAHMDVERLKLWEMVRNTPNLTWMLLTKRPENMLAMLPGNFSARRYPNVWLGVTAENQHYAEIRLPRLLAVDAAVHFVSAEPLLGPIRLRDVVLADGDSLSEQLWHAGSGAGIEWVITGGESGVLARPSHPDWFRSLRDEAVAAGAFFHHKQWGEWAPRINYPIIQVPLGEQGETRAKYDHPQVGDSWGVIRPDGTFHEQTTVWNGVESRDGEYTMLRVGKKAAGRTLDGKVWDEVPA